MGEDCLKVDVYTPGLDNARRPVMVWLHGGVARVVPLAATDLGGQRRPPSRCRLSAEAVRALVEVVASAGASPTEDAHARGGPSTAGRLVHRLEGLGYKVTLEPAA